MPQESQHTEWKAAWQDEHLRWVCGFANAEGGANLSNGYFLSNIGIVTLNQKRLITCQ